MSYSPIEKFVNDLSDPEKIKIIQGWEWFSKAGSVGEEPVRIYARQLLTQMGQIKDTHIIMWMRELTMECFRSFAMRYIEEKNLS